MNAHTHSHTCRCVICSSHYVERGWVEESKSELWRDLQLAGHEMSTYICLKMEHLIYMFKALSIQPAAKVNTSTALVFPKRFSRTLNILTKLSN